MRRHIPIPVVLAALLATGLAMLSLATPVAAEEYQYTARVFPGNRGTLSSDPVSVSVPKGADIDLYQIATANVTDSRYVQTGFRLSGQDTLYGNGRVNGVSEDMDFVVAYGVEADVVPYTLRFVEYGTGRELAEPKTYYGREGDKPVAAFEHIDGYRPRYLAITGTLHRDEENVWTFEYVPLGSGEEIVTTTTNGGTTYVPSVTSSEATQTPAANDGAATDGRNGNATGGATTTAGDGRTADGGARDGATTETQGDATGGATTETQEILDLDTPLAGPDGTRGVPGSNALPLTTPAIVVAGCLGALTVAGVWLLVARRRKARHDEEA